MDTGCKGGGHSLFLAGCAGAWVIECACVMCDVEMYAQISSGSYLFKYQNLTSITSEGLATERRGSSSLVNIHSRELALSQCKHHVF